MVVFAGISTVTSLPPVAVVVEFVEVDPVVAVVVAPDVVVVNWSVVIAASVYHGETVMSPELLVAVLNEGFVVPVFQKLFVPSSIPLSSHEIPIAASPRLLFAICDPLAVTPEPASKLIAGTELP